MIKAYMLQVAFVFILTLNANAQKQGPSQSKAVTRIVIKGPKASMHEGCQMKFLFAFNDSISVLQGKNLVFSEHVNSNSDSVIGDMVTPYIKLKLKNSRAINVLFFNQRLIARTYIVLGYRFLYVYKEGNVVTFNYQNEEIISY